MQTQTWAPAPADGTFLDLRDYGQVIRRRWKLVLVVTVVAVAAAALWTGTQTAIYQATSEILVRPALGTTGMVVQPLNVQNERERLRSLPVATLASEAIDLDESPRELLARLSVTTPKDADVLQVGFIHTNPGVAAQGAQAFANAYLTYATEQAQAQLDQRAQAISDNIATLEAQGGSRSTINDLRQQIAQIQATPIQPGEILVPADTPGRPTSPDLPLNVALGLFAGLFAGLLAAFVRERMDDRLRGRADLEESLGIPVMTMIPEVPSWRDRQRPYLVVTEAPRSPAAEAYRTLRTSILVAAAARGIKSLMVVSAMAGEGKTTTAANLAVVLGQADKRVVLISADLRRPRLHEFFGLASSERGLSDVLGGTRRVWESLRSGKVDNLWVMSSGKIADQPTELLQSETMRQLLADQREVVDFIILDCPPVLAVADALVLAPMVDAVLFVADAEKTPRGAILQARAQLDQVGARLLGSVLNGVEGGGSGYAYYGQYADEAESGSNGKAGLWHLRKDRAAG